MNTLAKQALYNNLDKDESLALQVDQAVHESRQDGWRENSMKTRRVRLAIRHVLAIAIPAGQGLGVRETGDAQPSPDLESETDRILELVKHQNEY